MHMTRLLQSQKLRSSKAALLLDWVIAFKTISYQQLHVHDYAALYLCMTEKASLNKILKKTYIKRHVMFCLS